MLGRSRALLMYDLLDAEVLYYAELMKWARNIAPVQQINNKTYAFSNPLVM